MEIYSRYFKMKNQASYLLMATMDYTHRNSIYHTNPKWRRYMVIRSTRCKRFCLCDYFSSLSLKYGEKHITRSDIVALISCLILIVFWLWVKDDILALILVCLIDTFAFFPTWRKSWLKPKEENISMYALSSFKSFLSLFGLRNFIFVNWLYPVFLIIINFAFTIYLVWRRKIIKK